MNADESDEAENPMENAGVAQPSHPLKIALISLHGLIRAHNPELGRDADTGGQIKYVLEMARELATRPEVGEVELLTRQIIDPRVSDDYAQLEEPISDKAKIVRIPFGPKRYLRKESLWPYLEMFIDQTLPHFKRNGLPDVIHGHYADAGYAGAQLARLLRIPFVFTGHSLGRVKRERLSIENGDEDILEKKYRFTTRCESEEFALETATMVITSTNQEVKEQYELYDHYVPARMEIIPPGVDLSSFSPPPAGWRPPESIAEVERRFFCEPNKPVILAMARADERKNLDMMLHVYGQSDRLREMTNLALIVGTREDIRGLPKAQQVVFEKILYLIDYYDLYGKIAYPKAIPQEDVPEIYRWATVSKGVFVNPALTEPFGLTLLEAGATGLPIIAPNDGGPRDIIANCRNGVLIDPMDAGDIEKALLRALTDPDQWEEWSTNGLQGTRAHYSWTQHVTRYLRDIKDIHEHSTAPSLTISTRKRRLPSFDRLIITDLDNTLTGDDEALERFIDLISHNKHVGFGIATGRRLDSAMELIEDLKLPRPDLIDTDVGTQIHYGEHLTPDRSWRLNMGFAWQPDEIRRVLDSIPGLYPQAEEKQSEFKISYEMDPTVSPSIPALKKILREAGLRAKVIFSLGMYLDIIPVRGGSDLSMRHVLWKWGFAPEHVLVAGDCGNDAGMLLGRTLGVVVANHSEELNRLRGRPRVYFAQAAHAGGILEGIEYYNFLDKIVIPNDGSE